MQFDVELGPEPEPNFTITNKSYEEPEKGDPLTPANTWNEEFITWINENYFARIIQALFMIIWRK